MKGKTRERTLSILGSASIILFAYPVGMLVRIWFKIGRLLGRIRIMHEERLPENLTNTVVAFNHPSVIDPFLIAGLLSEYHLNHPLTQAPLIAADRKIFYDRWPWRILRPVLVPIDREHAKKEATSLREIRRAARPRYICPEGGRTFKGNKEEWVYCEGGTELNGGKIRPFKNGVGLLVEESEAVALPIAVFGSNNVSPNSHKRLWTLPNPFGKLTMIVGKPMHFDPALGRKEITRQIQAEILKLMSEAI